MRILLIEDDLSIASFIFKGLKQEGYIITLPSDLVYLMALSILSIIKRKRKSGHLTY